MRTLLLAAAAVLSAAASAHAAETITLRGAEIRFVAEIPGEVEDPFVLRIELTNGQVYEFETDVGATACAAMLEGVRADAQTGLDWTATVTQATDTQTMNGVAVVACSIRLDIF